MTDKTTDEMILDLHEKAGFVLPEGTELLGGDSAAAIKALWKGVCDEG